MVRSDPAPEGRPRINEEIRSFIQQMRLENADWGAPKILAICRSWGSPESRTESATRQAKVTGTLPETCLTPLLPDKASQTEAASLGSPNCCSPREDRARSHPETATPVTISPRLSCSERYAITLRRSVGS